jgi:hypothetical protein
VTSGPGTDESPAVTRPRMLRAGMADVVPTQHGRRVRNPARGQSPRQDRLISRNRIGRIFDGRSSPAVASNHILDSAKPADARKMQGLDEPVARRKRSGQGQVGRTTRGADVAETPSSSVEGMKPAKGRSV